MGVMSLVSLPADGAMPDGCRGTPGQAGDRLCPAECYVRAHRRAAMGRATECRTGGGRADRCWMGGHREPWSGVVRMGGNHTGDQGWDWSGRDRTGGIWVSGSCGSWACGCHASGVRTGGAVGLVDVGAGGTSRSAGIAAREARVVPVGGPYRGGGADVMRSRLARIRE